MNIAAAKLINNNNSTKNSTNNKAVYNLIQNYILQVRTKVAIIVNTTFIKALKKSRQKK